MSYNTWEKDFCLEQTDFPRRIDLNPAWHETLAKMRQLTAEDGYERWGLIGVTEARDRALISEPQSFVLGDEDSVDAGDKLDAMWAAEQKGIPYVVGTVHSHPSFGKYVIRKFNLTIGDCLKSCGISP